jgi:hypothetical protein
MRAKRGIIDAAERLVAAPVRDAVLVQFNYRLGQLVFIPLMVIALATAMALDLGTLGFAIGGALAGIGFVVVMQPRFVIGAANGLFLSTSRTFPTARPKQVLRQLSASELSIEGGFINKVLVIGGERHLLGRAFVPRLKKLVADAPALGERPDVPPGYQPYGG